MKNKYEFYKLEYKNFVILFKCGNFYISINNDANVMNNIFNHKIVDNGSFMKTGFPISSLNKIITELEDNNHSLNFNRINLINKILKNNISNSNINDILNKIERIICKINY